MESVENQQGAGEENIPGLAGVHIRAKREEAAAAENEPSRDEGDESEGDQ